MGKQRSRRSESAALVPVALTIAGSDCSGGAGIQADLKTFAALGVYGLTAVTCVVAEIPGKVSRIEGVTSRIVRDQIEVLLRSFPVAAIKTGLLFSASIITEIAHALRGHRSTPLVIDPVMVATSGDPLFERDAIAVIRTQLVSQASLVTPNLHEAAMLTGEQINDEDGMARAGEMIVNEMGAQAVLVKGGHLDSGDRVVDILYDGDVRAFRSPRINTTSIHGTGCTLSAAIAAQLSNGESLHAAVRRAIDYVHNAIATAPGLGGGHGPLNHLAGDS